MKRIINFLLLAIVFFSVLFSSFACDSGSGKNKGENENKSNSVNLEDNSLYFGMYGILPKRYQSTIPEFADAVADDQFNVFNLGVMSDAEMDYYCQLVFDAGKKFWLHIQDYVWKTTVNGPEVREDCYRQLNLLRERFIGKSWYDSLLGWHIDEPLLQGMNLNELYKGSKAIHEVFPEKRFWVNFAGYAFNEDITGGGDRMTKETAEFITDISFDLYGKMNDTIYETWNNMIAMFEGEGKYFWAIPMCMSFSSKTDEASAIEHLEEFYRLIKNTKGGCGIMLYTGLTYSWEVEPIGNIGYYDLQVSAEEFKTWKNRKKPWSSYYERFYDKNGNAINGGFEPWTDLKSKIEEVSSSVNAHNKANVKKIETDISIEQNAVFEYNGLPQYPEVYPDYLNYEYGFMDKSTEIMSSVPPVKVGEYEIIVTLPESHFRKGTTVRADYRIKESDKTLILPSEITENYYGSYSGGIALRRKYMEFGLFGIQAYDDSRNEAFEEFLNSDFINAFLVGDLQNCQAETTKRSIPSTSFCI